VQPRHVWHACWTTDSWGRKRDTNKVRTSFTVLKTLCDDTKGKSLNFCQSLFGGAPVSENPRQVNDFCDPTTVFLLFNFHPKVHMTDLTPFRST